jgi:hypothetical protein
MAQARNRSDFRLASEPGAQEVGDFTQRVLLIANPRRARDRHA